MAWTRQTQDARQVIQTVSRYRAVAAAYAAVVRRRCAPRIRALCAVRRPGPPVLFQSVCRLGDRHHVERKRRRNNRIRTSLFAGNLTHLLDCVFVADLSLALASSYDCGRDAGGPFGVVKAKQENEGDAQPHDPQSDIASGPPAVALFTDSPASGGRAHREKTGVADSTCRPSTERPHRRRFQRQWRNR